MAFNPGLEFSTTTTTPQGAFDVQSTATHEIGHLLGLDHSGIAHAMMYAFGDTGALGQQRTLSIDDAAGVAFLYQGANFPSATGTISGQVTLSGSGIFAAHVLAIDATSGDGIAASAKTPHPAAIPANSPLKTKWGSAATLRLSQSPPVTSST